MVIDRTRVTSEKVPSANVQKALYLVCPVNTLTSNLIVIKSADDLKLGRKFNILYNRTKIKIIPYAEKCTHMKLIKIKQ